MRVCTSLVIVLLIIFLLKRLNLFFVRIFRLDFLQRRHLYFLSLLRTSAIDRLQLYFIVHFLLFRSRLKFLCFISIRRKIRINLLQHQVIIKRWKIFNLRNFLYIFLFGANTHVYIASYLLSAMSIVLFLRLFIYFLHLLLFVNMNYLNLLLYSIFRLNGYGIFGKLISFFLIIHSLLLPVAKPSQKLIILFSDAFS